MTQTQEIEESEQLDELLLETSWYVRFKRSRGHHIKALHRITLDDNTRSTKAKEVVSLLSTLIRVT